MTPASASTPPFLNVVIPTRDRPAWLRRCLRALAAQTYPAARFDVTVCDDGSRDDLAGIVADARRDAAIIRYLRLDPPRGPAAARNRGWRTGSGEVVVFLDDDVIVPITHLANVAACFQRFGAQVAAIEGRVEPLWEGGEDRDSPFVQTLQTSGGGHSCNIAFWRSALERVGGFDEGFPSAVGEDYDLAYRVIDAVGPIHYEPGLLVHHAVHGERSVRALLAVHAGHRPSWLRLYRKHPAAFPPPFLPPVMQRVLRRWVRRPTPWRFAAFLLLRDAVTLHTHRRLVWRRPALFGRWAAFVVRNGMAIVREARVAASAPEARAVEGRGA